jgi:hypothetical protein
MEQREHPRKSVDHPVRLVHRGRVVAIARAVNLSATGIGIEYANADFEYGQVVEVDFYKTGYPRGISCCLHARVVHAGPELMGLVFADDDSIQTLAHEKSPVAE